MKKVIESLCFEKIPKKPPNLPVSNNCTSFQTRGDVFTHPVCFSLPQCKPGR